MMNTCDTQQASMDQKEHFLDQMEKEPELAVVASTSFIAAWELLQSRNEKAAS